MCVCVCEREREREEGGGWVLNLLVNVRIYSATSPNKPPLANHKTVEERLSKKKNNNNKIPLGIQKGAVSRKLLL